MKKAFTLALVGALGLGAAAVAIPAALSNVAPPALAAETSLPIVPDDIPYTDGFSASWNPELNGFDITIKTPKQGGYYDENDNYQRVDLTVIDKVVVSRSIGYSGDPVEVKVFENPPVDDFISFTDVIEDADKDSEYYYKTVIYVGEKTNSYPSSKFAGYARSLPEAPKDITYTTVNGMAPVTISFTAPEYFKESRVKMKENIDKIVLYTSTYDNSTWSYVTTEYGTLENVEPGSKQQFVLNELPEEKTYAFKLRATAYDGDSETADVNILIGKDSPADPTGVTATETADGKVLITWEPVTTGYQGGFFDPAEVTYSVYSAPNKYAASELLAKNLTECKYEYDATALTEPTQFVFSVKAVTLKGSSSTVSAPTIIAGPASPIPFVETFNINNREADKLWSFNCPDNPYVSGSVTDYIYVSGEQTFAVGGMGSMFSVGYYASQAGFKSYYTSAKIDVEGYETLSLSFQLLHILKSTGAADAQMSFDGGEFVSVVRGDMAGCEATEWTKYSDVVTVPAGAKTAVMRFVLEAGTSPDYVSIDEISLRDPNAKVSPYPASASDLAAVYDFEANHVKVTFKAPALSHHSLGDINDQPLEYITKIELFRQIGYGDYTLIETFDNPEPGKELSYVDTDLATGGEYYYKVVVYVDDNCDFGQFLDKPVKVGQRPAEVTDFTGVTTKGKAPVVLTFTAPALDEDGEELRSINSIKVRRKAASDYSSFNDNHNINGGVLTDVEPGKTYTVKDETAEESFYYNYQVVVCGTGGDSYGSQISVLVGPDQPDKPTDVVATVNDDKTVTVTWEAPAQGINNGYIDVENLSYIVLIGTTASDYNATELAKDIKETTYTYTPEPGNEKAVRFFVKAVNGSLVGYSAITDPVIIGDPATLPYQEKFNNVVDQWNLTFNNIWTTTSEGSSDQIQCAEQAYMPGNIGSVTPVDNDGGLAYIYYGTYSDAEMDQYLTSGNINVEGHEMAVISFYYYAVPGYQTTLELNMNINGSDFFYLWDQDYTQLEGEAGWQKVEVPVAVSLFMANTIQLQFHAHKGAYACSAVIDDVTVYSLPSPVLEANSGQLVWSVEPNEFAELTGFKLYKNNTGYELHSSHAADVTSYSPEEEGLYAVTAVYGENLETLESNEVELKLDGIGSVAAGSVTVKALAGNIVVEGAEGLAVSIATVDGRVIYSAEGDATVSVVPGIYLVKVAGTAVKLNVR